jgi:3-phenylpropionate/cinnamic acid dioxygenase small subunit
MTATDRLDIAELLTRLAHLLDNNDVDELDTVYTEDVEVHSPRGGELHGLSAVTKYVRESQVATERTHHMNTDILITLDGDQAEASANQLVHFFREGEAPHQKSGLHTSYTAVRTPAGWRFRKARITLAWTEKN